MMYCRKRVRGVKRQNGGLQHNAHDTVVPSILIHRESAKRAGVVLMCEGFDDTGLALSLRPEEQCMWAVVTGQHVPRLMHGVVQHSPAVSSNAVSHTNISHFRRRMAAITGPPKVSAAPHKKACLLGRPINPDYQVQNGTFRWGWRTNICAGGTARHHALRSRR